MSRGGACLVARDRIRLEAGGARRKTPAGPPGFFRKWTLPIYFELDTFVDILSWKGIIYVSPNYIVAIILYTAFDGNATFDRRVGIQLPCEDENLIGENIGACIEIVYRK